MTLTYQYDDRGNITSVSDGTKTTSYVYDAIGQLIRVNDETDMTAGSTGTTWVFTYDLGGNILTKTAYPYTTETVGTAAMCLRDISVLLCYSTSAMEKKKRYFSVAQLDLAKTNGKPYSITIQGQTLLH